MPCLCFTAWLDSQKLFLCKWQASYSYGSMVNDLMLERMVFRFGMKYTWLIPLFSKHGIRRVSTTDFYANHSMNVEESVVVV